MRPETETETGAHDVAEALVGGDQGHQQRPHEADPHRREDRTGRGRRMINSESHLRKP